MRFRPRGLYFLEQAQGEAWAVDGDDQLGLLGFYVGDRLFEAAVEAAEAGKDFGEAHDGEGRAWGRGM